MAKAPAVAEHFAHIFTERANRSPADMPATIRAAWSGLLPPESHTTG